MDGCMWLVFPGRGTDLIPSPGPDAGDPLAVGPPGMDKRPQLTAGPGLAALGQAQKAALHALEGAAIG